jgi:hypothetical protein
MKQFCCQASPICRARPELALKGCVGASSFQGSNVSAARVKSRERVLGDAEFIAKALDTFVNAVGSTIRPSVRKTTGPWCATMCLSRDACFGLST